MKIKKHIFSSYIFIIYILLFPFEILNYYSMVSGKYYVPVGILAYLLILPLIMLFIISQLKFLKNLSIIYLLLFLFFLVSVFISLIFSSRSNIIDYYTAIKFIIYFVIGFNFYRLFQFDYFNRFYIFFAYIISITIVLLYFSVDILDFFQKSFNYFRISEALVFILVLAHAVLKNKIKQYILFALGLGSLFFINSRASLIGYGMVFLLLMFLKYSKKHFIILLISLSLLIVFYAVDHAIKAYEQNENRILRLFVKTYNDTSLNSRKMQFELGIKRIKEHPFTGNFKGQLAYGDFGSYIHNIFSFWAQFGILNFISIISMILLGIIISFKKWENTITKNFTVSYFFYTVLLIIASKSYVYTHLYLSFGMILAMSIPLYSLDSSKDSKETFERGEI